MSVVLNRDAKLVLTLGKSIGGYWDGGTKDRFEFRIDSPIGHDAKGDYVRVGSWSANYWFCVAVGKSTKATLANAKTKLARLFRDMGYEFLAPWTFEEKKRLSAVIDGERKIAMFSYEGV